MTSHISWNLVKEFATHSEALREIEKLRNENKLLKAKLHVAEHPDDTLQKYGDGSWRLYAADGFMLDWYDGD